MRAILCNLLATMLLVHALAGCCRCHRDAVAQNDATPVEQVATKCCCEHCDDTATHHTTQHGSSPCDCKIECKGLCIYVPTPKCVVDASQMVRAFDSVPATGAEQISSLLQLAVASRCNLEMRGDVAQWPPMRLHLLHQIILI